LFKDIKTNKGIEEFNLIFNKQFGFLNVILKFLFAFFRLIFRNGYDE